LNKLQLARDGSVRPPVSALDPPGEDLDELEIGRYRPIRLNHIVNVNDLSRPDTPNYIFERTRTTLYKQRPDAAADKPGKAPEMEVESFPNGIKLTHNSLGGFTVEVHGQFAGWIHAGVGEQWTAYVRGSKPGDPGTLLGRYAKNEAVQRIAFAAGWRRAE
jgi:hypothetical protein